MFIIWIYKIKLFFKNFGIIWYVYIIVVKVKII